MLRSFIAHCQHTASNASSNFPECNCAALDKFILSQCFNWGLTAVPFWSRAQVKFSSKQKLCPAAQVSCSLSKPACCWDPCSELRIANCMFASEAYICAFPSFNYMRMPWLVSCPGPRKRSVGSSRPMRFAPTFVGGLWRALGEAATVAGQRAAGCSVCSFKPRRLRQDKPQSTRSNSAVDPDP